MHLEHFSDYMESIASLNVNFRCFGGVGAGVEDVSDHCRVFNTACKVKQTIGICYWAFHQLRSRQKLVDKEEKSLKTGREPRAPQKSKMASVVPLLFLMYI